MPSYHAPLLIFTIDLLCLFFPPPQGWRSNHLGNGGAVAWCTAQVHIIRCLLLSAMSNRKYYPIYSFARHVPAYSLNYHAVLLILLHSSDPFPIPSIQPGLLLTSYQVFTALSGMRRLTRNLITSSILAEFGGKRGLDSPNPR